MNHTDERQLLAKFNGNSPVNAGVISKFERVARVQLPRDYFMFLQHFNGGEGFVGASYLILWRVEDLLEFNRIYRVADFAPGLLLFGSDGGGEAFAFDMRTSVKPIVRVPFVGMELNMAHQLALNFRLFLEHLFSS